MYFLYTSISFISHQENSWTLKIFLIQASCWLEWGLISTDTVYNPQLVNACKKETGDKLVFHISLFRLHNVMLLFLATLSCKTLPHFADEFLRFNGHHTQNHSGNLLAEPGVLIFEVLVQWFGCPSLRCINQKHAGLLPCYSLTGRELFEIY